MEKKESRIAVNQWFLFFHIPVVWVSSISIGYTSSSLVVQKRYYELILFNTNYNFDMYCEYDVYYHVTHLDVNMKERTLVLVFIDISIITGNTYCNLENIAST